jgi:putative transposase
MKELYSVAGISKQGHFQALARQRDWESRLAAYVGLIVQTRDLHPAMGLRAIYEETRPDGIGRDAFIALGLREGFRLKAYQSPFITTRRGPGACFDNLLGQIEVTGVNQVWVSDITYFPMPGATWYLTFLVDLYSRLIVGYSAADNMRASNNVAVLNMALAYRKARKFNFSLIHHSDRGSQYTSHEYLELLAGAEIKVSMCSNVLENAHCERVNGLIKNDYLRPWLVDTPAKLLKVLPKAIHNFNRRKHGALGKISPIEFERKLPSIPVRDREVLKVFTMPKEQHNPNQLRLF